MLAHVRELIEPDGVAYVSTPNVLTLAPEGRGALRQPVARARVQARRVPRAVRAPLRPGRPARPLPRPQAAGAPGRDRAPRLGPRAQGPALHQAVLRPLHARDLGARLHASGASGWTAASTCSPCCGREAPQHRPAHPHALCGGLRHVAVRRGVAVGGDRDLLPAAAGRARRATRARSRSRSPRCSPTSSRRRARSSAAWPSCARSGPRRTRSTPATAPEAPLEYSARALRGGGGRARAPRRPDRRLRART